jgi:hypothetical protein
VAIYGVDIHPRFQAGINIEEIRREGFDFMAVKVSEGVDSSYLAAGSADFLQRSGAAGLLRLGYHYLDAGNEEAQAKAFAGALDTVGVPGMLDAEAPAADGQTPSSRSRASAASLWRADASVPGFRCFTCRAGIGNGSGALHLPGCRRCGRRHTSASRPHRRR